MENRLCEKFGAEPSALNPPFQAVSAVVYADGWLRDAASLEKGGKNAQCGVPFPDNADSLENKLHRIQGARCRLVVRMSLQSGASPRHVGRAVVEMWDPYRTAVDLANDIDSLRATRNDLERKLDVSAPKL